MSGYGKIIVSFSMIATLPALDYEVFYAEYLRIKSALCPDLQPDSWPLHMKDVWNIWKSDKRRKLKDFKHISEESLKNACIDLGNLLRKHSNGLLLYNCSGVFHKPRRFGKVEIKQMKERVFYPLVMRVCSEFSKTGVSPHLYFEQAGDDGWAKNLFTGGRLTAMWPVLTCGMPIASPEFVSKTYDFRLEIADFISFVIARYLFLICRRSVGAKVDLDVDPSWLGVVRYLGFYSSGYCKMLTDSKYPLGEYFKGTGWEHLG